MLVHPDGESNYGVYSTPIFNLCCVTIHCNTAVLQRIVPCKKQESTYFKPHSTEVFRLKQLNRKTKRLLDRFIALQNSACALSSIAGRQNEKF